MKSFEGGNWRSKHNWVDKNNCAVGYDTDSSCCENAGYEYSLTPGGPEIQEPDLEQYSFDPGFFQNVGAEYEKNHEYGLDSGDAVAFRMVNDTNENDVVYLTLYNCHNGYYGHGFEFKVGENTIQEGCL